MRNVVPTARSSEALLEHYDSLQRRWCVTEDYSYESLVTPNGNSDTPVHRWFHLKEGFSHRLLGQVLKDTGLLGCGTKSLRVLDPFAGAGTTLISAADLARSGEVGGASVWGVEVNPFLGLVAAARLAAVTAPPATAKRVLRAVLQRARETDCPAAPVPALSTFANREYFPEKELRELRRLVAAVGELQVRNRSRLLALLCVGICVEPASRLRRDGRALRYEARDPVSPYEEFARVMTVIVEDLAALADGLGPRLSGSVTEGDGRTLASLPDGAHELDLVLFSPPYPNNIDYTEVYKIENWALGFITGSESFRTQRLRTLRSHPSVRFPETYGYESSRMRSDCERLMSPVLSSVPRDHKNAGSQERLIRGYLDDMLQTFISAYRRIRPGGYCVCVVGNSLHGAQDRQLLIASDLLLARLAEIAGFHVQRLHVARRLRRRGDYSELLRESVLFFEKGR